MMRTHGALALLALTVGCGGAGHPAAAPARLVTASTLGPGVAGTGAAPAGSPIDKYLAGDRTFGVYPITSAVCDREAWNATAQAIGSSDATVPAPDAAVAGREVKVGAVTGGVVDDLARIFTMLRDAGGTDLDGQHVCVVPATGVGPGVSTSNGYVAFDPAALLAMNELIPDDERTMYSLTVAMAHELAHQFQYRYGNPFADDKTARHTELAADCMGTAFVAMTQPDGWIMAEVEKGAVGALQAYADVQFASQQHHGTRVDRGRMARDGLGLVAGARKQGRVVGLPMLKSGCELAVKAWDASMPLVPPDQLWGGTEP